MTTDTEKTAVIFRKWNKKDGGGIIALFPYIPYNVIAGDHVLSYEHTGQHSGATYGHVINSTRPATPAEYADLKAELESIGYNLQVITRRARR